MHSLGHAVTLVRQLWNPAKQKPGKDATRNVTPKRSRASRLRKKRSPEAAPIITSTPVQKRKRAAISDEESPAKKRNRAQFDDIDGEGEEDKDSHKLSAIENVVDTETLTQNAANTSFFGTLFSPIYGFFNPQRERGAGERSATDPSKESLADEDTEAEDEGDEDAYGPFDPWAFIRDIPPPDKSWRNRAAVLPLKTRKSHKYTLVLDLDETLVHCTTSEVDQYHEKFPVIANGIEYTVFVRIRPHMFEFLKRVSQIYEVVLFTASLKVYADKLLDILDPDRVLIKHRLFRDDCVRVSGNYVKDLAVLGRSLDKTLIVDNSPQAFAYHVSNGVPIESWFDDDNDRGLIDLLPFLEKLVKKNVRDVRPYVRQEFELHKLVESSSSTSKC